MPNWRSLTAISLTALVGIPAALCAYHFYAWKGAVTCAAGTSPSSLTFSYTSLRPGSAPSCLSSATFTGLDDAEKLDLPFDPTPAMLLYWNGLRDTSFAPFTGKRVLLGQAYPAGVYAYDLDARRILWRHDFYEDRPGLRPFLPINSSDPVIDRARHRLYGTFIEERFKGKEPASSRLTQHYYSISLDGTGYEEMAVDFSRFLLEKGTVATPDEIRKYIRCRSALAFDEHAGAPRILSGCSIVRAFSFEGSQFIHQASFQSVKGIRGLLLALPLDPSTGRFRPLTEARAFIPSKLGSLPGEGIDAGIWHSGGAPGILPDGQILLATGNGVYHPEHGVYGCAIVRLRADGLTVAEPGGSYFSIRGQADAKASELCHEGNLDPSSSAPATLELGGRFYSAMGGKDGWIRSFDPYNLPGASAVKARESKVVDGNLFGQPVVFASNRFHMLAAIGGNDASGWSWEGYAIDADYNLRRLWTIHYPHPRSYNSSGTGTYREAGTSPLLFIPAVAGAPKEGFPSHLIAVDAETGRQLGAYPFHGSVHFSMPTVVDDLVIVPTAEHGIYVFRSRHAFHDYLALHAPYLARFF